MSTDWSLAKKLRGQVWRALALAKKEFIMQQLSLANGDSRKFWNTINSTFLKNKPATIDCVYRKDTNELVCGLAAANEINDFFATLALNLQLNLALPSPTLTKEWSILSST